MIFVGMIAFCGNSVPSLHCLSVMTSMRACIFSRRLCGDALPKRDATGSLERSTATEVAAEAELGKGEKGCWRKPPFGRQHAAFLANLPVERRAEGGGETRAQLSRLETNTLPHPHTHAASQPASRPLSHAQARTHAPLLSHPRNRLHPRASPSPLTITIAATSFSPFLSFSLPSLCLDRIVNLKTQQRLAPTASPTLFSHRISIPGNSIALSLDPKSTHLHRASGRSFLLRAHRIGHLPLPLLPFRASRSYEGT